MTTRSGARFSIVTVVHEPPARLLRAALASVRRQTYPDWQLCIVDDTSAAPKVRSLLEDAAASDARVVVTHHEHRLEIAEATNDALALATGEFVAFLDHCDELHPAALERVAAAIDTSVDVDYVYTDEDTIDELGNRSAPFYKPDWSPDRLRCQHYTGALSVVRRSLLGDLGGLRTAFEDLHLYDLVLRVGERARRVVHVPEVLYHSRTPARPAVVDQMSLRADDAADRAVAEHLTRTHFPARVDRHPERPTVRRIRPTLRDDPLISMVIPTGGYGRQVHGVFMDLVVNCVESIVSKSTYANYEIVCVADDTMGETTRTALMQIAGDRLQLVPYSAPFNFSRKINHGVFHSRGRYLLLLNDDIEVITPEWLESMLMYAEDPGVGAVGAKLLFADNRIQHAGVVCVNGNPGHPYYGYPHDHGGYADNLLVPSNYLAVTAACLMTRRDCFDAVGGLSPVFPLNYNDVDFCLKLHRNGYRIVFTPAVELYHYEASSRLSGVVDEEELGRLRERWETLISNDPFYNRNFLPTSANFVHRVYLSDGTSLPA